MITEKIVPMSDSGGLVTGSIYFSTKSSSFGSDSQVSRSKERAKRHWCGPTRVGERAGAYHVTVKPTGRMIVPGDRGCLVSSEVDLIREASRPDRRGRPLPFHLFVPRISTYFVPRIEAKGWLERPNTVVTIDV